MKIRESARSRIPLLRSLSGSVMIGSRSRSKSQSKSQSSESSNKQRTTSADQDQHSPPPPVPAIPPISQETDFATSRTTHTPIASTQPSIAITDVDKSSTDSPQPNTTSFESTRHARNKPSLAVPAMLRKIWVKRPNASATRVEVNNEDLVDNVRDVILLKYANSLGRSIDSPDIILKIITRDQLNTSNAGQERVLGPEEPIGRTLDDNFPGGQTIEDALIIELAKSRSTPRPSPRPGNHQISYNGGYFIPQVQYRPDEGAPDYFGPINVQSPQMVQTQNGPMPSMAILTAGQMQPLPSPGGTGGQRRQRMGRPAYGRQHTSSPTIMHSSQSNGGLIGEPQ